MPQTLASKAATTEEIICSFRGNGMFTKLMACSVGVATCAISTQVTLLGYLVPCVAADWDLSSTQEGSLTASVFAGELVGGMGFGVVSDAYGRRPTCRLATALLVTFGLLTSLAPSFWWLLACRAMVGVGVAGGQIWFDLLGEVVPKTEKGGILVNIQATWAVGSLYVGVVSWAVLGLGHSWRWIALLATIPAFAMACCLVFIPESPRWLLTRRREREAEVVLRQIAKRNKVEVTGISIAPEEQPKGKYGGPLDLWRVTELRKRTVVSCIYWASFGFLYYGIILLSAKIMGDDVTCSFDYAILFFASSSELVFIMVTKLYLNKLEWSDTATMNVLISAVITGIMPLHGSLVWLLLTSFVARGTAYVTTCLGWIITPELYPTEVRCTGHSMSCCCARIGGMGASYWVASSASNERSGLLLLVVGVIGGFTAQVFPRHRRSVSNGRDQHVANEAESNPLL